MKRGLGRQILVTRRGIKNVRIGIVGEWGRNLKGPCWGTGMDRSESWKELGLVVGGGGRVNESNGAGPQNGEGGRRTGSSWEGGPESGK